ncbi:MAG TPA: phytanoyl-CoA dioxygenase family protein [Candidatus Polarisedimenticolia bacterium]|nr:phytanoyl-CoA dioxygenase family protein [Candidatus Polarisedimenticolia bacterium]
MIWAKAIQEQGFGIILNVLAQQDVVDLLEELSRANLPRTRAGVRHAMRLATVAAIARGLQLLGIAQQILGGGAFPFRATLFDKSPTANWLVVWHQDTALPLREQRETPGWGPWSVKDGVSYAHAPANALSQVLALRLHLDDSTAENGPLRVLPRTHTLGVLSDKELHDLSTRIAAIDCVVPRGGVLAMRPLIVHASSKSQTNAPRRVLHIEYAASQEIADGLELAIA